jgi:hypothetical protein
VRSRIGKVDREWIVEVHPARRRVDDEIVRELSARRTLTDDHSASARP